MQIGAIGCGYVFDHYMSTIGQHPAIRIAGVADIDRDRAQRVGQFREQVGRRLAGELTEEQFRPHRLMNGLYLQLHSYMLPVLQSQGPRHQRVAAGRSRDRSDPEPDQHREPL